MSTLLARKRAVVTLKTALAVRLTTLLVELYDLEARLLDNPDLAAVTAEEFRAAQLGVQQTRAALERQLYPAALAWIDRAATGRPACQTA